LNWNIVARKLWFVDYLFSSAELARNGRVFGFILRFFFWMEVHQSSFLVIGRVVLRLILTYRLSSWMKWKFSKFAFHWFSSDQWVMFWMRLRLWWSVIQGLSLIRIWPHSAQSTIDCCNTRRRFLSCNELCNSKPSRSHCFGCLRSHNLNVFNGVRWLVMNDVSHRQFALWIVNEIVIELIRSNYLRNHRRLVESVTISHFVLFYHVECIDLVYETPTLIIISMLITYFAAMEMLLVAHASTSYLILR
jgi:predicted Fe-S protein YdhL (DUF1289 family)